MRSAWDAEQADERWSDTEAWRGDVHQADADSWRGETPSLEHEIEDTLPSGADESWRAGVHLAEWPEDLAGPEYWMFKDFGRED
jgi:hypothetical protein